MGLHLPSSPPRAALAGSGSQTNPAHRPRAVCTQSFHTSPSSYQGLGRSPVTGTGGREPVSWGGARTAACSPPHPAPGQGRTEREGGREGAGEAPAASQRWRPGSPGERRARQTGGRAPQPQGEAEMLRVTRGRRSGAAPGPGGIGEAMPCRCRGWWAAGTPEVPRRPGDAEGPVLSAPGRVAGPGALPAGEGLGAPVRALDSWKLTGLGTCAPEQARSAAGARECPPLGAGARTPGGIPRGSQRRDSPARAAGAGAGAGRPPRSVSSEWPRDASRGQAPARPPPPAHLCPKSRSPGKRRLLRRRGVLSGSGPASRSEPLDEAEADSEPLLPASGLPSRGSIGPSPGRRRARGRRPCRAGGRGSTRRLGAARPGHGARPLCPPRAARPRAPRPGAREAAAAPGSAAGRGRRTPHSWPGCCLPAAGHAPSGARWHPPAAPSAGRRPLSTRPGLPEGGGAQGGVAIESPPPSPCRVRPDPTESPA